VSGFNNGAHSPELRELYEKAIDHVLESGEYGEWSRPIPDWEFSSLERSVWFNLRPIRIIGDDSGEYGAVIPDDGIGWPLSVSVKRGGSGPFGVSIAIGPDLDAEPSAAS
jgi:hypothetical protein